MALSGCTSEGKGANTTPVADLKASETSAGVYMLDASASKDPDGDSLTYHWNWVLGNATTDTPKIEVEFPEAVTKGNSNFFATVVVRDGREGAAWAGAAIVFGEGQNKAPKIELANAPRWVKPGTEVTLDLGKSTDPDKDALAYEWIFGPRLTFNEKAQGVEDACAQSDPTLQVFTTGCLDLGEKFNLTFEQQGTITIHCHPHPWMKARIVVDPTLPAEPTTIEIRDFAYPAVTTVGVGSTVTFVNLDPVAHTATVEDYTPGIQSGGDKATFKHTFAAGEYVVRAIVTDPKGGRATQTWGVKAGDDALDNPLVEVYNSSSPLLPSSPWRKGWYNVSFETDITAVLTYDDPGGSGTVKGNFSVGRVDADNTLTKQDQCVATPDEGLAGEPPRVVMNCTIKTDNYLFEVTAGRDGNPSVVPEWQLTISGVVKSRPNFGDTGGGDGHGGHTH